MKTSNKLLLSYAEAWDQLHSNVMHYQYTIFEFACIALHYVIFWKVMHYITLLFKCNALHYTLLFTNFKQTKSVHIDILHHIIKQILSYKENSVRSLFLMSCFKIVVSTVLCLQEVQCDFLTLFKTYRKDSRILNQDIKNFYQIFSICSQYLLFYIHKSYNLQRHTRNVNTMVCLTFNCVRKVEFIFFEPERKWIAELALSLKFTISFCLQVKMIKFILLCFNMFHFKRLTSDTKNYSEMRILKSQVTSKCRLYTRLMAFHFYSQFPSKMI